MKTRRLYLINIMLKITDLLIVNISFVIACKFFNDNIEYHINYLLLTNYLWILASFIGGVYQLPIEGKLGKIYSGSIKTYVLFAVFFLSVLAFSKEIQPSVKFILLYFNFILIGLFLSRFAGDFLDIIFNKRINLNKTVAVFGNNTLGLRLSSFFENSSNYFSFKGDLSNGETEGSITEFIDRAAKSGVKELYLPMAMDKLTDANNLLKEAEKRCIRLKFVPDFDNHFIKYYKIDYMGSFPILSLRHEPLEDIENRFSKRLFDICVSLAVLIFVLSWLYPIIGLIIKIQSPGPILFKQQRNGRDNQLFTCYKFRSMKSNNGDFKQATKNDSRVTPIGKFIRRTSIDEFPQFLNVILGNMSIVGPRPHPVPLTEQYKSEINEYMVRHFLKSGITGWAQVNGYRGETNTAELMRKRIEHDVWYLENWSLGLDFRIFYLTFFNVFKGEKNAY